VAISVISVIYFGYYHDKTVSKIALV